jgi:succinate-semialdehyde dehydrogenase/glutarate-semialdehyde dehydrogenase
MAVIDDSRIRGVAQTGGVAAARGVAERAGRNVRKSTMDLGGSDAFIVLEDADLDLTLKWAMWAKMKYMGQCCIAAKRFIIMESFADRFPEKFRAAMAELKPGDPMDKNTKLGPSSQQILFDDVALDEPRDPPCHTPRRRAGRQ